MAHDAHHELLIEASSASEAHKALQDSVVRLVLLEDDLHHFVEAAHLLQHVVLVLEFAQQLHELLDETHILNFHGHIKKFIVVFRAFELERERIAFLNELVEDPESGFAL